MLFSNSGVSFSQVSYFGATKVYAMCKTTKHVFEKQNILFINKVMLAERSAIPYCTKPVTPFPPRILAKGGCQVAEFAELPFTQLI